MFESKNVHISTPCPALRKHLENTLDPQISEQRPPTREPGGQTNGNTLRNRQPFLLSIWKRIQRKKVRCGRHPHKPIDHSCLSGSASSQRAMKNTPSRSRIRRAIGVVGFDLMLFQRFMKHFMLGPVLGPQTVRLLNLGGPVSKPLQSYKSHHNKSQ